MWLPGTLLLTDCNLGSPAFERVSQVASDLVWEPWSSDEPGARDQILERVANRDWDLAISFYSDFIVPAPMLDRIDLPLNIHPALPRIRGVGHDLAPLVEGHAAFGVTLHEMEPALDSGPIYDVIEVDMPAQASRRSIRTTNQAVSLQMLDRLCRLMETCPDVAALRRALSERPASERYQWGEYYSRDWVRRHESQWESV